MPEEYAEYLMGEKFGKLSHEFDDMPEDEYRMWLAFMQAEANAERLRSKQRGFYAK